MVAASTADPYSGPSPSVDTAALDHKGLRYAPAVTATSWPTDWNELAAIASVPVEQLVALHQMIDDTVDPVIVELCRLRIAGLIGARAHLALRRPKAAAVGLTEAKIAALASWPTSPHFSAAERACLAFTEQFCMGAYTVTEAIVAEVLEHLSADECYAFANGVWVMEALARMTVVMGVDPDPHALGLVPAP
jgi:alkylhydroperoxidase family enzyme